MDFHLRRIERAFQPGEFGEVVFRLNREAAEQAGFDLVSEDVRNLSNELARQGMVPWPDKELATLKWGSKTVSIFFVQTGTPSSMYQTPALFVAAIIAARLAATTVPVIVRGGTLAWLLARGGALIRGSGAIFARLGRGMSRSRALGLVTTGLLIWSLVDIGSLVEVFKWTGQAVGKGVVSLLKEPIFLGMALMGLGLILATRSR
jgi:hypothetical protein